MSQYLLDTNVLIAVMRRQPEILRKLDSVELSRVHVSSVVQFELWYGVAKGGATPGSTARMNDLMERFRYWLPFEHADAQAAGRVRAALEAAKQPIGPYDTLIAGQALARGMTLVTANEREFRRVEGLRLESWMQEIS